MHSPVSQHLAVNYLTLYEVVASERAQRVAHLLLCVVYFYFETRNLRACVILSIWVDPHDVTPLVSGVLASGFAQNVLQPRLTQDDMVG